MPLLCFRATELARPVFCFLHKSSFPFLPGFAASLIFLLNQLQATFHHQRPNVANVCYVLDFTFLLLFPSHLLKNLDSAYLGLSLEVVAAEPAVYETEAAALYYI